MQEQTEDTPVAAVERTAYYEHGQAGRIQLNTFDAKHLTLVITPERLRDYRRALIADGYKPHNARTLTALTNPVVDPIAMATAIRIFCDAAPSDASGLEALMNGNRRRLESWWRGLKDWASLWFGVKTSDYDVANTGRVVTDGETALRTVDGKGVRVVYRFNSASRLQRSLLRAGFSEDIAVPRNALSGLLCIETLAHLLVTCSKAFGESADEGVPWETIDAFLVKNREHLWGWWMLLQQMIADYYAEEALERKGEAGGAG